MEESNNQRLSINQIYEQVTTLFVKENKNLHEVKEYLLKSGLTEEDSKTVIDNVTQQIDKARKEKANKNITYGLFWSVGGALVTFIGYDMASREGGVFIITWGAIIFGVLQLFKGLFNKYLIKKLSSNEQQENGSIMRVIGIVLLSICFIHALITGFNYTITNATIVLIALLLGVYFIWKTPIDNVLFQTGGTGNNIGILERKSKSAILYLRLTLVSSLLLLGWNYWNYQVLQNESQLDESMIIPLSYFEWLISLAFVITMLISAITFIRWFREVYLCLSKIKETKYSINWTIWSWFIPIINWWYPYKIMKEIYLNTKLKDQDLLTDESPYSILRIWWLLWLAGAFISQIANRYPEETIEQQINVSILMMVICLILIIDVILLVRIIKNVHLMDTKQ